MRNKKQIRTDLIDAGITADIENITINTAEEIEVAVLDKDNNTDLELTNALSHKIATIMEWKTLRLADDRSSIFVRKYATFAQVV